MGKRLLKAKLRRLYLQIRERSDDISCGAHLASFIRPDIDAAVVEFNRTLIALQAIDPEAQHLKPLT